MREPLLILFASVAIGLLRWTGIGVVSAGEVVVNHQTFTLKDGFNIELIAGPPLVSRPVCADLDEQGNLYVAESSGSNDPIEKQLEERPHSILKLSDLDGDGRYDSKTVFADRMPFPQGTLWYQGSLYVAAPPAIWKLTDADGDSIAEKREIWFDGKTLTACANDLHGPFLGPDGWIYWCKGGRARQRYERPGREPLDSQAAHIFRRRPEGGVVESVMTGGMENPVEVAFTPGGECIFTSTFLIQPQHGLRDGLMHAVHGGLYGRDHGVLARHPQTGPVMPVLDHMGAAAPSGLASIEGDRWGKEYQGNLMTCLFNMQKVTRHILHPDGATFRSETQDFVVSDNRDFHPTDILEDADGSLILIDTGGWYKLCCPTSQLWKPDVLGGIYRIQKKGVSTTEDAYGQGISWSELGDKDVVKLLNDPRPFVRRRARWLLQSRGERAITPIAESAQSSKDPSLRLNAVWTLVGIDSPHARAAVRASLNDDDEIVRTAALRGACAWGDRTWQPDILPLLNGVSMANRRGAAEALGRFGDPSSIPYLMAGLEEDVDRFLEHSLMYAVIEIGDASQVQAYLKSSNPRIQKAALMILDQIDSAQLTFDDALPFLTSNDSSLRQAAWEIASRNPGWAAELLAIFRTSIHTSPSEQVSSSELSDQLKPFLDSPEIQSFLATSIVDDSIPAGNRVAILRAMASRPWKRLPASWIAPVCSLLSSQNGDSLREVLQLIRQTEAASIEGELLHALLEVGENSSLPDSVRLQSLAMVPPQKLELTDECMSLLAQSLASEAPLAQRSLALDLLERCSLSAQQGELILEKVPGSGATELRRLIGILTRVKEDDFGIKLVRVLSSSPAATSLRVDHLQQQLGTYGPSVVEEAQPLFQRIRADHEEQLQKLESILQLIPNASIRRGQEIFHSSKAACSTCHAVGYLGGRVGPDLTRIGKIRDHRDLLEAVIFPSASFVRGYEPVVIATHDGEILNGIIEDQDEKEIVLRQDASRVTRIQRENIEDQKAATVSMMPAGLDKQLSLQELADLIAFLKSAQ